MCDTLCAIGHRRALFGKNSDRPRDEVQVFEAHPARAPGGALSTTHLTIDDEGACSLVGSRPLWMWGFEHGVNEHRVAIGNERIFTVDDPRAAAPALTGMDLVRLGLERATTADHALDVMTTLLQRHGQGGRCAADEDDPYWSSFLVADPTSAWILETSGREWVAARVEDGAAISNRVTLGHDWTRASPGVEPGADFDAWRDPRVPTVPADDRLTATRACIALGGDALSPAELAATLRHHGDRPWGAPATDPRDCAPLPGRVDADLHGFSVCFHVNEPGLLVETTTASMIADLAAGDGPLRAWVALGTPCSSVFIPVFPPRAVPPALGDPATWARFAALRDRVEADPAALAEVRAVLGPVETELWQRADADAADAEAHAPCVVEAWRTVDVALAATRRVTAVGCLAMEYNLADLWEKVVDTVPTHEAMVCGDRRLTYADAEERSNRLAHALDARGVRAGDHVALYLYNGTEYLEGMLAAYKLRAVPINVNYRYVEDELRYLLDNSDAAAVVYHREFTPKLTALRAELPRVRAFLAVDDGSGADLAPLGADDYDATLAAESPDRDFDARSPDDLYILYTGGTTGMPKGVMWRHEDIFFGALGGGGVGNPISAPEEIAARAGAGFTRCLPACPFMHGTAHWMAFQALFTGGTVVIDSARHMDPAEIWRLVAREHVNFLVIVGDAMARPLVEALERLDGSVDVSGLSLLLSGGAILSPAVKRELAAKLPGTIVIDGIGSSEAGGQGQMAATADGEIPSQPRFIMGPENTVLTDDLRPAPVGVVGKLARCGHIPLGYYHDPEKTAATFPEVDGVRWSIPGDHARIESDGSITVLGRGSVSINTGGEKVYPEEVEGALKSHPDVFDAIVVGVPDDRWGERVVAVVQTRDGARPSVEELDAHTRTKIAGYKAPRDVVFVDTVVRSPSGKPDYRWAKQTALQLR